jgi:hypothetical protein
VVEEPVPYRRRTNFRKTVCNIIYASLLFVKKYKDAFYYTSFGCVKVREQELVLVASKNFSRFWYNILS